MYNKSVDRKLDACYIFFCGKDISGFKLFDLGKDWLGKG